MMGGDPDAPGDVARSMMDGSISGPGAPSQSMIDGSISGPGAPSQSMLDDEASMGGAAGTSMQGEDGGPGRPGTSMLDDDDAFGGSAPEGDDEEPLVIHSTDDDDDLVDPDDDRPNFGGGAGGVDDLDDLAPVNAGGGSGKTKSWVDQEKEGGIDKQKVAAYGSATLAVGLFFGIIAFAWFGKDIITALFPQATSVYEELGVETNTPGQGFRINPDPPRTSSRVIDGVTTLIVSGNVINIDDTARPVPGLRLELRNARGETLQSQSIGPPSSNLGPHESVAFEIPSELTAPAATSFEVLWEAGPDYAAV